MNPWNATAPDWEGAHSSADHQEREAAIGALVLA